MIAYAAVQVPPNHPSHPTLTPPYSQAYVGLSSMPVWDTVDGTFNLIHFYHLIVKTISDETDKWVAETMDWWQR
jgi:hypothetical protein